MAGINSQFESALASQHSFGYVHVYVYICTHDRTLRFYVPLMAARKVKRLESLTGGLINTFSYRLCSWCLGRRPSGTKEHPRTLRNCRRPLRPVPGSSGQPGSSCFRFSATDRIVVVSRSFFSLNPREQSPFAFLLEPLFRGFLFLRARRCTTQEEEEVHSLEDASGVSRDLSGFLADGGIVSFL